MRGKTIAPAIPGPVTRVAPWVAVLLPGPLVLPIVTYPLSYTVWQAIDLTFREVDPGDFDAAHIVHGLLDDD